MVQDLRPGPNGGAPSRLVAAGGSVYFVAAGLAATGQTTPIYRTDPATGAPSKIGEVELRFPQFATDGSADGAFYIVGWHAPNSALYKYDPANPAAGLTLVADLVNLNGVAINSPLATILDLNGDAVFVAEGPVSDARQLWRSEGTEAGTTKLAGFPLGSIQPAYGAGGLVYLAAATPGSSATVLFPYRT